MSNIKIVNLASHTTPKVVEDTRKDWVEYGEDNNYFQHLIDRYNGSATNNAIINGMVELIYGRGLSATDASRKPDEYAQLMSLFKRSCMRRLAFDLKAMGQAAFQVIYNKGKTKVVQVEHMPIETIRFEKMDDDGEICGYYYAKDWTKSRQRGFEPQRIPAFGKGKKGETLELFVIRPYRAGFYYYSPVDYQGGLPYAELEEEVANYHINNIKNGLAPSMLINFNNGVPTPEEQELMEHRIRDKFSGSSNAGKFILAFNDNKEASATIEPVQLSDASEQYQFLADESMRKVMVAHRVTSPMLLGIKDNSGLGNNADELKTASLLFHNTVVRPIQELILDAIDEILAVNGVSLNVYIKTLQPLEFTEDMEDPNERSAEDDEQLSLSTDERPFVDDALAEELIQALEGLGESEEELEGYELVDSEDAEDEPEDFNAESYLNGLVNLSASQDSSQDNDIYKVRYKYVKGTKKTAKGESRPFCKTMITQGKLYRKEDIGMLSARGVNKKHGHKGRNYSLFKYKGGVNCHHRWERRIYKKKLKKNGEPYGGDALRGTKFVNVNQAVRAGFKLPKNPTEVAKAPVDMPNNGHHPNYGK